MPRRCQPVLGPEERQSKGLGPTDGRVEGLDDGGGGRHHLRAVVPAILSFKSVEFERNIACEVSEEPGKKNKKDGKNETKNNKNNKNDMNDMNDMNDKNKNKKTKKNRVSWPHRVDRDGPAVDHHDRSRGAGGFAGRQHLQRERLLQARHCGAPPPSPSIPNQHTSRGVL